LPCFLQEWPCANFHPSQRFYGCLIILYDV
jgi:hypothetical protein